MGAARRRGAGRARPQRRAERQPSWRSRLRRASPRSIRHLSGVVEVFDDAIAAPDKNGTNLNGPFAGLPFLMKDLGPTMQGRLQEMGSLLDARQSRHGRYVSDRQDAPGRAQSDRAHDDAGVRRVQLGRQSRPSMSPAIPGTRTTPPAALRPAVLRWSRPAPCRSRTPPTAAARSAFRPASTAISA